MAKITYDGRSFSLDGQRLWLVSGTIDYLRVPRGLWRDRIRAARQAGLNCVTVTGVWNLHEKAPGELDFSGERDVRHFVELLAEEGMFCILRPGPFVGGGWDNGGLPAWLERVKPDRRSGAMKLREGNGPFLSAVSRYFSAILGRLHDLQITTPPPAGGPARSGGGNAAGRVAGGFVGQGNGPILMVQVEHEWLSANDEQDDLYHQQLIRLLREAGTAVPLTVCNQLWQEVDGTIHTWNGSDHLPASLRQLSVLQPDAPRLVSDYRCGSSDHWGVKHAEATDAEEHLHRMAGILATASQFNLAPFHGGTNFGFSGGRGVDAPDAFVTTSHDDDAPLLEAGGRGARYLATKRIATFASQFAGVLAHLDAENQSCVIAPDAADHPLSVVHLSGQRGAAVFLLKSAKDRTKQVTLLLPGGLSLPVTLGNQRAAWLLLDARLGIDTTLDYTNLCPLAFVDDRLLVVFGPAGSPGVLSINDTHVAVKVPAGKTPLVEMVDGVTLVVLSTEMADASYLFREGLVVGSAGLDERGEPLALRGWATQHRVGMDGQISTSKAVPPRKPVAPKIGSWRIAGVEAYLDGSAPAFDGIEGPASLASLGQDVGYGWYRLAMPAAAKATAAKVLAPGSGDRLHIYRDGRFEAMLSPASPAAATPSPGSAPGSAPGSISGSGEEAVSMRLSGGVTILADNLGGFHAGQRVGEAKGVLSHLYAVKPAKLSKPTRTPQLSPDAFVLGGYIACHHRGTTQPAEGLSWVVKPAARQPMILTLRDLPVDAVVKVNGQAVDVWDPRASAGLRQWLLDPADDGPFTAGKNTLELALFEVAPASLDVLKHVKLHQATANLTARAAWSFAAWTPPEDEAYAPAAGRAPGKAGPRPAWFRTTFSVASTRCPLFLHPRGMSKGQLYLNGQNLGRYFMQTRDKKAVPPQSLYYLPEPWLNVGGENTLALFDEHGFAPTRCELRYGEADV